MKLFKQSTCASPTTHRLYSFYQKLSTQALINRKKSYKTIYIVSVILWVSAMIIGVISGFMDFPLLVLHIGITISIVALLGSDYNSKMKMINEILKNR